MKKNLILILFLFGFVSFNLIGNNTFAQEDSTMGIKINSNCIRNGQCSFDIYKFLNIRQSTEDSSSPTIFVQDILLAATFFIGTIITLAIIVSGIMFIMSGLNGKDPSNAKKGLINSFIGLLITISAYIIIRLVQYIAKGL